MSDNISRDEALLWLNDRLGQRVLINVGVDCGDYSLSVLSAVGQLRHSSAIRSGSLVGEVGAALRDKLLGLYAVGQCDFDISDLRLACEFAIRQAPRVEVAKLQGAAELVVRLRGGIEITITPAADDVVSGIDV